MTTSPRKILILGLDGAAWQILGPLIEAGEMPHLAALVASSARGTLLSSIPPLTAPAWTSFQTGANPGKHRIFDFRVFDRQSRQLWLASARDIQLPTLWQIASEAGLRVVAVNVPMTYPPQPVNGLVIGGMLAQREDASFLYPSDRLEEVLGRHPDYRISPPVISQRKAMGRRAYVDANIAVERARCSLALDLMAQESWDLFMVQNQCLDYIQHAYVHFLDSSAPEFDPRGQQDVLRFYRAMDENVGRLLEAAPSGTDVLVLSDHGFQLQRRLIHLAPWLRSEGFLVEHINSRQRLLQFARRMDIFKLRRHFAHWILRDKAARFGAAAGNALRRIDWQQSRAFVAIGSVFGCLYLNRQIVADPLEFLQNLQGKLLALRDPETGEQVVKRVFLGRKIYHGPYAEEGPDLIAEPTPGYTFGAPSLVAHRTPFTPIDFDLEIPGGHHPQGIFIWHGSGVSPVADQPANLMDMAPTVLARLGLPVPAHMDGRVLAGIFEPPLEVKVEPWESTSSQDQLQGFDQDDEATLAKRLRDLGYL